MEKKKSIRVSLGTVICLFIIIVLIVIIIGMYLFYNKKQETTDEVTNSVTQASNEEANKVIENQSTKKESNLLKVTFEKKEYNIGNVTNTRNLPIIISETNQEIANKIQNSLKEFSDKKWKEANDVAEENKNIDYKVGVNLDFSLVIQNNNFITFRLEQKGDFGGVGWNDIGLYCYNIENRRNFKPR